MTILTGDCLDVLPTLGRESVDLIVTDPPDYTAITYRKKPAADGPRYRALGNSMAVPCMWWLGHRIHQATR